MEKNGAKWNVKFKDTDKPEKIEFAKACKAAKTTARRHRRVQEVVRLIPRPRPSSEGEPSWR
jgi:hypothetical protein